MPAAANTTKNHTITKLLHNLWDRIRAITLPIQLCYMIVPLAVRTLINMATSLIPLPVDKKLLTSILMHNMIFWTIADKKEFKFPATVGQAIQQQNEMKLDDITDHALRNTINDTISDSLSGITSAAEKRAILTDQFRINHIVSHSNHAHGQTSIDMEYRLQSETKQATCLITGQGSSTQYKFSSNAPIYPKFAVWSLLTKENRPSFTFIAGLSAIAGTISAILQTLALVLFRVQIFHACSRLIQIAFNISCLLSIKQALSQETNSASPHSMWVSKDKRHYISHVAIELALNILYLSLILTNTSLGLTLRMALWAIDNMIMIDLYSLYGHALSYCHQRLLLGSIDTVAGLLPNNAVTETIVNGAKKIIAPQEQQENSNESQSSLTIGSLVDKATSYLRPQA